MALIIILVERRHRGNMARTFPEMQKKTSAQHSIHMINRVFIQLCTLFGLSCFSHNPGESRPDPALWDLLQPIGKAHAYKVQKVCEEIQTKHGPRERCRSVLLKEEASASRQPEKDEKKDAGKGSAGHGTGH